MRRNLWLLTLFIFVLTTLGVLVDIPKSPLAGDKIKALLGLDLVGGTELIYEADLSASTDKIKDLDNLSNVFRQRVDQLGVSEPTIQTSGGNRIIIELPGIKNIDEAVKKIGDTYELVFMEEATAETGVQLADYYDPSYTYPNYWKPTDLTGRELQSADATFQSTTSNSISTDPITSIKFNNTGKEKFKEITKRNLQKQVAIVLDNRIVSAPQVQVEIANGEAVITGAKTIKDAQQLSRRLNEGMLPVPAKLVGQRNVGATLGQDSLKKSMVAGIIGLLLIAIFMMVYYKVSGLIAVFALIIYAILSLAIYKVIPVTLTLAGIAGFILSIGMAIDANILIFERMKEELRSGKVLNLAITDGFRRAWSSVRDSNFSSILTCLILYYTTGTGPVRGFALTLGIGVVISMFTAITVTRTILHLIAGSRLRKVINV
ncbi:MAG: preprotein translocase subunit SecD [bacterium ADurb.Bin400]|nr:MAG: preprotein translocase subunit SecD [bacterium ADurb.Bin400]